MLKTFLIPSGLDKHQATPGDGLIILLSEIRDDEKRAPQHLSYRWVADRPKPRKSFVSFYKSYHIYQPPRHKPYRGRSWKEWRDRTGSLLQPRNPHPLAKKEQLLGFGELW